MPVQIKSTFSFALRCLLAHAAAALGMCWVFDSQMMLQADRAVPVWGQTEPGTTVTVRFGEQEKTAVADAEGEWAVRYADAQYHDVNLGNGAGLPAAPFRTDDWPLRKEKGDK